MTTPTLFSRLICRLFGHRWKQKSAGSPPWWHVCLRCGRWDRNPEWTDEMTEAWLMNDRAERKG